MTEAHEIVRPRPLRSFPLGVIVAPGKSIVTGDVYLAGWSLRETTGAAVAQLDLVDGGDSGGVIVASIALAAGDSKVATFGGHLLTIQNGLFVAVNAGSVTGALWFADRVGVPHRRTFTS
jgi:hypothetical protein